MFARRRNTPQPTSPRLALHYRLIAMSQQCGAYDAAYAIHFLDYPLNLLGRYLQSVTKLDRQQLAVRRLGRVFSDFLLFFPVPEHLTKLRLCTSDCYTTCREAKYTYIGGFLFRPVCFLASCAHTESPHSQTHTHTHTHTNTHVYTQTHRNLTVMPHIIGKIIFKTNIRPLHKNKSHIQYNFFIYYTYIVYTHRVLEFSVSFSVLLS